jgi:hypothetical protein
VNIEHSHAQHRRTVLIGVPLLPAEVDALRAAAARRGISLGELMRSAALAEVHEGGVR